MVSKREKEPERDSNDSKKHRKTNTSTSNDQSQKVIKEDIYANVIQYEEQESGGRSPDKDSALFLQTCDKLKVILTDVAQLKGQNTAKAQAEIKTKRVHGSFLFTILKKLNRLDKVRLRAGRDALHKEKLLVDSNKLQLQNLLYEADHLRREVQHCLQFKSRDEEIDLVDEDKFYQEAPEIISKPEKTRGDEHARRLARLDWELQQRKELAEMCKNLQTAKESVAQKIESKKNRLNSLIPCLEQVLKSTRPLQEALGMELENDWAVQKVARLLPRPLYVAYMNLSAYAETTKKIVETQIVGDEEEAKELKSFDKIISAEDNEVKNLSQNSSSADKLDNDDDDDEPEHDGQRSVKKHHHNRQLRTSSDEINVYKLHPLSVIFKLPPAAKNGPILMVTLNYLPVPKLVTIRANLYNFEPEGIAARDVLDPNNILNCLVENEYDENEAIHPKTTYTLLQLSVDSSTFLMKLNEKQIGKPYTWAQNLCGLNFLTTVKSSADHSNFEEVQEMVPIIIRNMNKRIRSRYVLYRQILALEKKTYSELITKSLLDSTIKPTCILAQWSPITFNEYVERSTVTGRFYDENLVTQSHLLYHSVIIRGSAKMECFISVSPNFPSDCPIWAIHLNSNGSRIHSSNSLDIKEIEFWINSIDVFKNNISIVLVLQLMRAMHSLDIYLDSEANRMAGNSNSANDSRADKAFLKVFRSRTRSRPYRIAQNGNSIVYTQI